MFELFVHGIEKLGSVWRSVASSCKSFVKICLHCRKASLDCVDDLVLPIGGRIFLEFVLHAAEKFVHRLNNSLAHPSQRVLLSFEASLDCIEQVFTIALDLFGNGVLMSQSSLDRTDELVGRDALLLR